MKCPCCSNELELIEPAHAHMDQYSRNIYAKTLCCGNIVYCEPYISFYVSEADEKDEDSWGNQRD